MIVVPSFCYPDLPAVLSARRHVTLRPRVAAGASVEAFALAEGSPPLSAGLVLDAGTGIIGGEPLVAGSAVTCRVRMSSGTGFSEVLVPLPVAEEAPVVQYDARTGSFQRRVG